MTALSVVLWWILLINELAWLPLIGAGWLAYEAARYLWNRLLVPILT